MRDFGMLAAGGAGDGMAIDADGRLYVTSNPGVQVLAGDGKKTLFVVGSGAVVDGKEFQTPAGVRNNAKTIYRLPMLAAGFAGRAK